MSRTQSRDEVVSFINSNFDYLIAKGFKIANVEFLNEMVWDVYFEGQCQIRINWYWHDGMSMMISKSETPVTESKKWYSIETLVCFSAGKEVVEKFYEALVVDKSDYRVRAYVDFLSTHLDKIVEVVTSEQFEEHDSKLKKLKRTLEQLIIEKYAV